MLPYNMNRNIEHLQISVLPSVGIDGRRVEMCVLVNGIRFQGVSRRVPIDAFESEFDAMLREARVEMVRIVEKHFRGDGQSATVDVNSH